MSAPPACVAQLRDELVRAAARRPPRGRALVLAAATLLALAGGIVLVRPAPASADVHVDVVDGRMRITLVDLSERPEHLQAVLRSLGLAVTVTPVPVAPSQVGRLVGTTSSGDAPPELVERVAGGTAFAGFSVPLDWTGALDLRLGRPAGRSERYAAYVDALAPGEILGCRALTGRSGAAAAEDLREVPLVVTFQPITPQASRPLTATELARAPEQTWLVSGAVATDAGHVVVHLVPPSGTQLAPRRGQPAECER